jgi:hypothetical protein
MSPDLALAVVSALTGAVAMLIFRATSDQARIRETRNAITAHVLEMRIYQDDLALILRALGAALATNLRYLRLVLVPALAIAAVVAVVFIQLDARFGRAPLRPGETAMVTATLKSGIDVMGVATSIEVGEGAVVEGPQVRVQARREVNWRVRAEQQGTPTVTLRVDQARYQFPLAAKPGMVVGRERSRSAMDALLHPGLPTLLEYSPIERVEVRYPPARHSLFGWETHWLVVFVFWSLVGALALKLLLRIAI